jgi:acyl-CoA dehydrogenase
MQFDFSDDQKALRAAIRSFFAKSCPISVVRSVIDSEAGHDADLWRQVSASGFLAAALPEQYGGAGAGYLELCVVAEECGRVLAPLPTISSVYQATEALLIVGSEEQKATWLPKLGSGGAIGTLALTERAGEALPGSIAAEVSQGKLRGVKIPVVDGLAADIAIVMAKGEDSVPSLFLVDSMERRLSPWARRARASRCWSGSATAPPY